MYLCFVELWSKHRQLRKNNINLLPIRASTLFEVRGFTFLYNMNTSKIQKLLLNHLSNRQDFNILTTNYSWALHFEADVFQVKKNGFIVEYEIKSSRGDFLKDFKKSKKIFNGHNYDVVKKHDWLVTDGLMSKSSCNKFKPNEFYFVCPSGLISAQEIPKSYGLIHVMESGQVCIMKRPKKLHKRKELSNLDIINIARNFTLKQCSLINKTKS